MSDQDDAIRPTHPLKTENTMKFVSEDNDNCRVYYREEKRLYCWQLDRPGQFQFFRCSSDGEPSHEVQAPLDMPFPAQDTRTGEELAAFLKARQDQTLSHVDAADLALFDNDGEAVLPVVVFNRLFAVPGLLAPNTFDANGRPTTYGDEDYRDFDGNADTMLIKCALTSEARSRRRETTNAPSSAP